MFNDFASNLSLLCSYYPSIAEVCRQLEFNRQQFNKYLNGQSRPSRSNMRRICDFFGVTEPEILSDTSQFQSLVAVRNRSGDESFFGPSMAHLKKLYHKSQNLDRYLGYYYRYFFSFSNVGQVVRSLGVIYKADEKYYWKNIERIRFAGDRKAQYTNKYEGIVLFVTDRIYIIEYETLQVNSLTQVTLYPSYHSGIGHLVGIQTGGPTRRGRRPAASKVLLEFLGHDIDPKRALQATGVYDPGSGEIAAGVIDRISNDLPDGSYVLEVKE